MCVVIEGCETTSRREVSFACGDGCWHSVRALLESERGVDERALAERLSSVWSVCWPELSGWETAGPAERSRGLEQGWEILGYVVRSRLAEYEAYPGELREYGNALWALQSIGEGYALLSEPWPISVQSSPALPLPDRLSAAMEENGVFEWAASLGYPLRPWQGEASTGGPVAAPTTEAQVAEMVGLGLRGYGFFLDHLSHLEGRAVLQTDQDAQRRQVCAELSVLRLLYDWQVSRGAQSTVRLAVALILTLTDAQFVALAGPPERLGVTPLFNFDVVSDYLRDTGVRGWLDDHGKWPIPMR